MGGSTKEIGPWSPSSHYDYTRTVSTARSLHRIIWRYLTVFYHNTVTELSRRVQGFSDQKQLGSTYIVELICQSGNHERQAVERTIGKWVKIGRRYQHLIDALGSGSLIWLPDQISDTV